MSRMSSLPRPIANQAAARLSVWSPLLRISSTCSRVLVTRYGAMSYSDSLGECRKVLLDVGLHVFHPTPVLHASRKHVVNRRSAPGQPLGDLEGRLRLRLEQETL